MPIPIEVIAFLQKFFSLKLVAKSVRLLKLAARVYENLLLF